MSIERKLPEMVGRLAKDDDLWARGESRIRDVLAGVETEIRMLLPEVAIRVTSSRDERSPLHVVAAFFWGGASCGFVVSVMFTRLPAPHQTQGPLVRYCKLQRGPEIGSPYESDESPLPESLGINPTDDEVNESIEDASMFARQCGTIFVNDVADDEH